MERILIADVSHWNDNVDYRELWDAGIRGVIIKAGQYNFNKGEFIIDPLFQIHYDVAREVGMLTGAYYYSTANNKNESVIEAEAFLEAVAGKVWLLPLCGDYEKKRYSTFELEEIVDSAAMMIEDANYYFMAYMDEDNYGRASKLLKEQYAMWVADWSCEGNKVLYSNTAGVKMHQFTSQAIVNGRRIVPYDLDISYMFYNLPHAIFANGLFGPDTEELHHRKQWQNIVGEIMNTIHIWGV